jgi:hypothetical protein
VQLFTLKHVIPKRILLLLQMGAYFLFSLPLQGKQHTNGNSLEILNGKTHLVPVILLIQRTVLPKVQLVLLLG